MQHRSNSWLKLSFSKQSKKLQNILCSHPFLWPIRVSRNGISLLGICQCPQLQKSSKKMKIWPYTTSRGILSHPNPSLITPIIPTKNSAPIGLFLILHSYFFWHTPTMTPSKAARAIPVWEPYLHPIKMPIPIIMAPKYKHGSCSWHNRNTCT